MTNMLNRIKLTSKLTLTIAMFSDYEPMNRARCNTDTIANRVTQSRCVQVTTTTDYSVHRKSTHLPSYPGQYVHCILEIIG